MNIDTLIGKRFGLLTVKSVYRDEKKLIRCIVVCDCGNKKECYYSNLKSGRTQSCGHLEKMNREKYVDMTGLTFSELLVTKKTDKRKDGLVIWECKCSCGRTVYADRKQLVRGYIKNCGFHSFDDLIGKRFGELLVKGYDKSEDKLFCECSCGSSVWVERSNLLNDHTKSCGHLRAEDHFVRVDGAAVSMLRMKLSKANTSGYKGVSKTKDGRWVAYITLRGKRMQLGIFDDIQDAVIARKNAEERLFVPLLKKADGL